ncbi:MAG TPA: hypothetical protein VFV40_05545, partial [Nocardioides sp.]|nr:hypothetical protein [Nocardioides sp.]
MAGTTLAGSAGLLAAPVGAAGAAVVTAAPDETKIPHYFGPYPNWANSPLFTATANVEITGAGTGAEALAQVDPATGAVTGITVTKPGKDYVQETTQVAVTGSTGTPATAAAVVTTSSGVVAANVTAPGTGYQGFTLDLAGGGGGTGAVLTPVG